MSSRNNRPRRQSAHVLLRGLCASLVIYPGLWLCCQQPAAAGENRLLVYRVTADKSLAQAVEDAEFAITDRNFRVTGVLHIGKGIRERGHNDFPDYEVILFCNLTYAKSMLELDPDYVNYCPARVSVRGRDGAVVIAAPLLPEDSANRELNKLMQKINSLIREVVDFAAQKWALPRD